ncbi:MAG: hypothetical protein HC768_17845 [Acaryochloris sp. CRU_2_0]|nr:hypothetical protein [Acaryochloris sp. CRU_2_0]
MGVSQRIRQASRHILLSGQRGIQWISRAIFRIFSPTDDHYPATGIQPFEGDPSDGKK